LPWEQTENFIRSGHRSPEEFEERSLRTITLSEEEGIKAVIGKPKGRGVTEVQSYLFDVDKGWTLENAKAWFEEHERGGRESFGWAGDVGVLSPYRRLIRGKAIHPLVTVHPEEWPSVRVYLEEELARSAETLINKPLFLDHYQPLKGEVLAATYEDGAIEYLARLEDPEVLEDIRSGRIKHCSVQFEWKTLENVDGVAPRGITFQHLSLLKNEKPGDPLSTVEIWESIIQQLKEAKRPQANLNPKPGKEVKKMSETVLKERVWDRKYINNLSDVAFAVILPGGEKDEEGKTVPRTLRKFPHHRADGSIDLPHLRNANSRIGTALENPERRGELTVEQLEKAESHLDRHKKAAGIGAAAEESKEPFKHAWREQEEVEFQVAPEPTMDELIESIEDIVEQINARLDALEARLPKEDAPSELEEAKKTIEALKGQVEVLTEQKKALREELEKPKKPSEAIISSTVTPPASMISKADVVKRLKEAVFERIPQHWGYGPYEQNRRIKQFIKELESPK